MVVEILKGKKPADIPVSGVKKTDLWLNPKSAKKMGVTLPEAMIAEAVKVVE